MVRVESKMEPPSSPPQAEETNSANTSVNVFISLTRETRKLKVAQNCKNIIFFPTLCQFDVVV